jgi:hypothetical protein
VKDLPAPGVVAPSSPQKPLEPTAAAAATLLARQRRCTLKVRMGQLGRLTELLYRSAHYRLLVPLPNSTPTGAAAAAADEARPDAAAAAAAAAEPVEVADRDPRQTQRQREWCRVLTVQTSMQATLLWCMCLIGGTDLATCITSSFHHPLFQCAKPGPDLPTVYGC